MSLEDPDAPLTAAESELEADLRKQELENPGMDIASSQDQQDEAANLEAAKERKNFPLSASTSLLYDPDILRHGFEQFFEIRLSKLGGFGAFAVRELRKGDVILVEKPLLLSDTFGLRSSFDQLSEAERKIYMNLHCDDNCTQFNKIEKIQQRNW